MCTFLLWHSKSIIELIPPLHVMCHASEVTLEDFAAGPLDLMINIPFHSVVAANSSWHFHWLFPLLSPLLLCLSHHSTCSWQSRPFRMSCEPRETSTTSCSKRVATEVQSTLPLNWLRRTSGGSKPSTTGRLRNYSYWGRPWRRWSWELKRRNRPLMPEMSQLKNFLRCCKVKVCRPKVLRMTMNGRGGWQRLSLKSAIWKWF